MATTKWKILKDVTTGGSVPGNSQLVYKAIFKKDQIVEGEEVDNPNYTYGMAGGAAPKVVKIETPNGPVYIGNTASLGPNGMFIAPYDSALPAGLPELPKNTNSGVVPPTITSSSDAPVTSMNWLRTGVIAGVLVGGAVGFSLRKETSSWYYMILVFMVIGGLAGSIADNKMKKIA